MFSLTRLFIGFLALSAFAQDVDSAIDQYKQGQYASAESTLRATVEAKPNDARANLYLGLALLGQEKTGDAEKYLQRANELETGGEAKGALARFHAEQKDLSRAESMLEGASGTEAHYARGLVAFNAKRYEEAVKELESFLEAHPKHPYAHYYAGMAYNGIRRPDKMLTHLQMFLQLKPDAREARGVRAILKTGR